MIGQTVSHYRIVRQLGAGGMGVVFAAEDPRLGRQVALKFVPDELAHDLHTVERLRSEARTASSLNHPNICTIYDIGEHEGRPFIVMELLSGHTLRERISSRPLKVHETLDIGIQVADALYAAHSRDIIHRDIKPANIFLVDQGPVKVLDFGLAKLMQTRLQSDMTVAPTVDLTAVGVALGTVAYMSPEQVQGEPLDRRTDLFSLGVVLYECATGQQPFKGKTSAVVLASILTQQPPPPISLNSEVPVRMQEIIQNCLEKDRELRYPDAAGLRTDLRRLKRDLESGSSGALRLASGLSTGSIPVMINPASTSGATTTAALARPASGDIPTQGQPVQGSGATASVPVAPAPKSNSVLYAVVGAVVVAAIFGGVVLLRTSPPAVDTTKIDELTKLYERIGAADRSPLGRASASLRAGDNRAALVYAEEALRADPQQPDALRIRNEARASIARFDQAILDAGRALASGNTEAATRAIDVARALEPNAPALVELSTRLVEQLRLQAPATQRAAAEPPSSAQGVPPQGGPRRPTPNPAPVTTVASAARPPSAGSPAPSAAPSAPAASTPPPAAAPASAAPASAAPPSAGQPSLTPPPPPAAPATPTPPPVAARPAEPSAAPRTDPSADRRPAPPPPTPAAAPDDDDALIRRVVATYARAIETKDLGLFRSVKPNMTPDEQRRIEDGFRAVTSQRVNVTILSIDKRGQEAAVRLRRQDTIQAGGRTQTADSQQTMTLVRSASGWVIREIGR